MTQRGKIMLKYMMAVMLVTVFLSTLWAADIPSGTSHFNVKKNNPAIQGYDPVSYFAGGPTRGNPDFAVVHDGIEYLFANKGNMVTFNADPLKYLPAFGGWCAWAMLDGEKVKVDPERFKIIEGVNYLFYDGFWGNTLKKWNERAKEEGDANLVRQAETHWQEIIAN